MAASNATADNFGGLELTFRLFKSQLKRDTDPIVLFAHWYLVKNGFACIIDGRKTEVLPDNWNEKDEYAVDYTFNSKGFELKILKSDDTVVVNLLKKSTSETATFQTRIDNHVVNYKNDFDSVYKNLSDLYEIMDREFRPLFGGEAPPTYQKFLESESAQAQARREPQTQGREPINDPLRVIRPATQPQVAQPPQHPASIGRGDLDPFNIDPLSGSSGMIFDPFRDMNRRNLPPNIPPGSVPPGARFDPYGPPDPEAMRPGAGRFSQRGEPNPDHMRAPRGFDDNMYNPLHS